jgi:RNA polymerase sigma factor (sigma-70 family)
VPAVFSRESSSEPWFEPTLAPALERLSERQRTAVVLICGFEWTMKEVAELMGVRVTTVQSHMERGLQSLRSAMEVPDHA